ncbi:MAG: hypothetical protein JRJ62_00080 [Deltaproteobacteria bacterium]|nr:hypothetical protein [Deltaproteobacteria bacterium]
MAGRFSVEAVFKAVDRVTAPITRMQNRVGKFTRAAAKQFHKLNRAVGKVTGAMKRGASAVLKFGGVAAAAGVAVVAIALNKVATAADELAKRTRRIKFPIEEFQEWQFVASQAGIDTGEFDKSLEKFTKAVGEARAGTGTLFTMLNKTDKGLLKQITSTDNAADAFDIYLKSIRDTENQLDKTALATAAFGRTGAKFLNITEMSTKAVSDLRKEQRENGIITKEQAAVAEKYNDAIDSLTRSLFGMLQNVLIPMMPAITNMTRSIREWIIANKDLIASGFMDFARNAKDALFNLFESLQKMNAEHSILEQLKTVISAISTGLSFLAENAGTILKIVAGVIVLSLALKTLTVIMGAINLVMALNPFGLMVIGIVAAGAAIAAITMLVMDNWSEIGAFFTDLWDGITSTFQNAFDMISNIVADIGAKIASVTDVGGILSGIGSFFGFGDDDESKSSPQGSQVVSPQARVARSIEEQRSTSTAEVTIRDETKRAELTGGKLGRGLSLEQSGTF